MGPRNREGRVKATKRWVQPALPPPHTPNSAALGQGTYLLAPHSLF